MTNEQWEKLLTVLNGEVIEPTPAGFVIDSPWLPGWADMSIMDYFTNEQMWFETNLKVVRRFPDIMFLPGFWSEFGMCTEPSAFGSKCSWQEKELPYADKILADMQAVSSLDKPNPKADGLLPFVLNRLKHYQGQIEQEGHAIKFAVARGPLNIASFLAGSTEFLMGIRISPDETHKLLGIITDFLVDWLQLQAQTFPSIDGIFILDDIVGFLGDEDFKGAALPYLERIYNSLDVAVKFFHNDAAGLVCAPYLEQIGVNIYNFSFQHSLEEMKKLTNNAVTLLGNIPTRDVLAAGTPEEVRGSVKTALESVSDKSRIIMSCGGGMPPDVSTENIEAFLSAVE
ncbi:MAG: uroporphyrinogen decarboxylase family protein [Phycisphaerales bacterium]|jgi:uroporphyrinogen decarboxylase